MRTLGRLVAFAACVLCGIATASFASAAPRVFHAPPSARAYAPALREADSLLWAQRTADAMRRTAAIRAEARAHGDRWPEMASDLLDAVAHGMSGRGAEAVASGRAAQSLARALGDRAYERRALRWVAFGLGLEGRPAASDSAWRLLLRSATAARDTAHMGYAHLGLGYLSLVRGDARPALAHYVPAVRLLERANDRILAATARVGLARTYERLGDRAGERRILLEILAEARGENRGRSEADALNNLGVLEYEAGDPDVAIAYWRQAIERYRVLSDPEESLTPVGNLASALQELGRVDEASAALDSALAVARRRQLLLAQAQLLTRRGELVLGHGRAADASSYFDQALAVLPPDNVDPLAGLRLDQLHVLQRAGDPAAALAFALRELPPLAPRVAPELRVDMELNLSQALTAAGRPAEGLEHARAASAEARAGKLTAIAPSAMVAEAHALRALGDRTGARAAVGEASRLWLARRALSADPARRERESLLGSSLALLAADLLLDGHDGDPARVRAAYDALQPYKSRTLLERMAGPGAPSVRPAPAPATLALVQRDALREGEVLLDAFTSEERSLLFVVTRSNCRLLRLPGTSALSARLSPYYGILSAPPREGRDAALESRTGEALADLVLGGAATELLGSRRVIVSPDGPLHLLPYSEMPLRSGAARVRLGEGREIERVPSATLFARLRRRASDAAPVARVLAWKGAADGAHSPLPGAEAEVAWLAQRVAHVDVHDGRAASAMPRDDVFASGDVLHFAAHTRIRDQRPWDSGLLLADSAATGGQGWLAANHITQMRLHARLVVLAGCETARGGLVSGEGAQGLTSAFLVAGAPTVVSSLWRVNDATTAQFVMAFYRQLLAGMSVARAVALAQAEVRATPETAAPYFWAGFVVVGDGAVRIPLRPRSSLGR